MSVRLDGEVIRLEGDCWVEQAETLSLLLADGPRRVDLGGCTRLHAAVAQALLAYGARLEGEPDGAFLRRHLLPALAAALRRHDKLPANG